jgi:hypothetical protein
MVSSRASKQNLRNRTVDGWVDTARDAAVATFPRVGVLVVDGPHVLDRATQRSSPLAAHGRAGRRVKTDPDFTTLSSASPRDLFDATPVTPRHSEAHLAHAGTSVVPASVGRWVLQQMGAEPIKFFKALMR